MRLGRVLLGEWSGMQMLRSGQFDLMNSFHFQWISNMKFPASDSSRRKIRYNNNISHKKDAIFRICNHSWPSPISLCPFVQVILQSMLSGNLRRHFSRFMPGKDFECARQTREIYQTKTRPPLKAKVWNQRLNDEWFSLSSQLFFLWCSHCESPWPKWIECLKSGPNQVFTSRGPTGASWQSVSWEAVGRFFHGTDWQDSYFHSEVFFLFYNRIFSFGVFFPFFFVL